MATHLGLSALKHPHSTSPQKGRERERAGRAYGSCFSSMIAETKSTGAEDGENALEPSQTAVIVPQNFASVPPP
jgi:hypothetical protein